VVLLLGEHTPAGGLCRCSTPFLQSSAVDVDGKKEGEGQKKKRGADGREKKQDEDKIKAEKEMKRREVNGTPFHQRLSYEAVIGCPE